MKARQQVRGNMRGFPGKTWLFAGENFYRNIRVPCVLFGWGEQNTEITDGTE